MGLTSIMSYPDRGKWGKSSYRGNCSGYVIRDLLAHYRPKIFVEVFRGGGTGEDVANEFAEQFGIQERYHLDLNNGWNALTDPIPVGADFVFSHPPYDQMVIYSGNMWGEPHPDDLSRCASYDEFIQKLDLVNAKIYASLLNGGRHAMLIGDIRKKGVYYSPIKDLTWFGNLESHIIKTQHNCVSDRTTYSSNRFIPIVHEHLLIFRKDQVWMIPAKVTNDVQRDMRDISLPTWRDLVQAAIQSLGGKAPLEKIYEQVENAAKAKLESNCNWEAKVRQTLQKSNQFRPLERGVWELAAA